MEDEQEELDKKRVDEFKKLKMTAKNFNNFDNFNNFITLVDLPAGPSSTSWSNPCLGMTCLEPLT